MDSLYFQLIDNVNMAVGLSTQIARNSNYKQCIREATDHVIVDCIKEAQRLIRTLTEVLNLQEYANVKNMPGR